MFLHYQLNSFESDFFQRKIATATIQAVQNTEKFATDLIAIKLNANEYEQIEFIQQQGFHLVEGEICFSLDMQSQFSKKHSVIQLTENHLAQLTLFSEQVKFESRFKPPYFSLAENKAFYQRWFENAVKGIFDDVCFAVIKENQIQGAITLKIANHNLIKIGLLGVLPQAENNGIASTLIQHAINFSKTKNIQNIQVSTQISNLNAIHFYQKFNAKIINTAYWFYKTDNDSL